jgi:hypothetical protein
MTLDKKSTDIRVKGVGNITAGGDFKLSINGDPKDFDEFFTIADNHFRGNVKESGVILQRDIEIEYSSKELFESLLKIGIPFDYSIRIIFGVPQVLADIYDEELGDNDEKKEMLSTAHIRMAVVHCIEELRYISGEKNQALRWSSAYIKRYGNPANAYLKVIDNGAEVDLDRVYVKKVILPHLLKRLILPESYMCPVQRFQDFFSNSIINEWAEEIIGILGGLNLYSIRYKTLIILLEDLALEPPHPWIVNKKTVKSVTEYNIERAVYHFKQIEKNLSNSDYSFFNHSFEECAKHLCASILSAYGFFLGVGRRYGFSTLQRILESKDKNFIFWKSCGISRLETDLLKIGCSRDSLKGRLKRMENEVQEKTRRAKNNDSFKKIKEFAEIVDQLVYFSSGIKDEGLQKVLQF